MSLDKIFNPESIAVIGVSRDENSVGYGILKNLIEFKKIYAVNPNAESILGIKCYPKITLIKEEIDLAVICTPAKIVEKVVDDCIKKRVKGIIIISAGFAEIGKKKLQDSIVKKLKKSKIPMIGPNCLGIIRPSINLNASFAPSMPLKGNIAFISQSGALANSIIDWSVEERYGFSTIVSYGNKAMLDAPDFIEYLSKDNETKAIAIYIEGIKDGKKLIKIAKKCNKPIIALKAGKTSKGIKAITTHTGSLAGSYEIYKAAFKQSNIIIAETMEELFDLAKAFNQPKCKNAIGIITNGGGCGVLCADYCSDLNLNVVELKKSTIKKLDKYMHPAYSRSNPLDIVGDALADRYKAAINILLKENYIHGLIILQTMQIMTQPMKNAKVIIEAKKKFPNKPIICVYMGGKRSQEAAKLLEQNGIPDYNDPYKAAKAMRVLVD